MRVFDWVPLFQKHRIHYIERGANFKSGDIGLQCPWCGSADPSQHLVINPATGWYTCRRHKAGHSGKSPVRLIMALLRVGFREARELAGLGEDYVDPDGFSAFAARMRDNQSAPAVANRRPVEFDKHMVPVLDTPGTRRWWNYLYRRFFDEVDITPMCETYGIRAATGGHYYMRLVLPYWLNGELVSWSARAIAPSHVRYKDLPNDLSIVRPKHTLWNVDCGLDDNRHTLVLVEGPLDALKLDWYGQPFGVRAVALSTNSLSEPQTYMLEELSAKFERTVVMLDSKTTYGIVDSMRIKRELACIKNIEIEPVPFERGDAAELLPGQVREWSREQKGVD